MQFILRYLDEFGKYLYDFNDVNSFSTSRKKNDIGITTITLALELYDYLDFCEDRRLEIYYITNAGDVKLFDGTCWFLRSKSLSYDDDDAEITLIFEDTITLLSRRIVAWLGLTAIEISPTESVAPNYPSVITESYSDIIKLIFFYNFSNGVLSPTFANSEWDTWEPTSDFVGPGDSYPGIDFWQLQVYDGDMITRKFNISQEIPDNQGMTSPIPSSRHDFTTCLTAMQEVTEAADLVGQNIWFDIIYTPSSTNAPANFYFKTWLHLRGTDRTRGTDSLSIGPDYGNITNFEHQIDWTERQTIIFAAGSGDNEARQVNSYKDDTSVNLLPFYPIEGFITPQDNDSLNALQLEAQKEVGRRKPKETFSGSVVNRLGTEFNEDFFYGDILRFQFADLTAKIEVDEYTIDMQEYDTDISIPFGSKETQ